jgi:quinol monooxygenase YgiN
VTFTVRLEVYSEHRDEAIQTFRALLGPIRGTAGCLRCHLLEDVQEPNEVELVVEWKTEEDFARHVRTDLFRRVLQGMELACEPPEVRIRAVEGTRGMDLLHEFIDDRESGR